MSGAPPRVIQEHLAAVRAQDAAAMARGYTDDAVLVRGQDRYVGAKAIGEYFHTVPARLAGGRVEVVVHDLDGNTVTIVWRIHGGAADGTSGRDVLVVRDDRIAQQTVVLDGDDF
jgi:uncharacterized protein (TIGR02246 family)